MLVRCGTRSTLAWWARSRHPGPPRYGNPVITTTTRPIRAALRQTAAGAEPCRAGERKRSNENPLLRPPGPLPAGRARLAPPAVPRRLPAPRARGVLLRALRLAGLVLRSGPRHYDPGSG